MLRLVLILLAMCFAPLAGALQFSADAVMSTPGRADVSTRLYYSNGRIRKEFYYYGEPVVQIIDANKHKSLMCFTEQRVCYENKSLEDIHIGIENAMTEACKNNKSLSCENQGEVTINKRKAIKWKIVGRQGKKKKVSYLWMDKELNIPVRQKLSNGTHIDLQWLGREKLNDRDTDKWLQEIALPNGVVDKSFQWFDRELKISIREVFTEGNSQELNHIVVKKLQDELFQMPSGYQLKIAQSADEQDKKSIEKIANPRQSRKTQKKPAKISHVKSKPVSATEKKPLKPMTSKGSPAK